MRYSKLLSGISVMAVLPLAACGGNDIQIGNDHGTGAAGSQAGTGGYVSGGSGGVGPTHEGGVAGSAELGGAAGLAGSGGSSGLAGMIDAGGPNDPPPPTPIVCPAGDGAPMAEGAAVLTDAATMSTEAGTADGGGSVCRCTRRPGGPPSTWCAAGDGTTVTLYLTPAGGTFSLGGWQARQSGVDVRLDIPQGAVSEPMWITLTETTCVPPSGFNDASPLYQFAPLDLVFARPINIDLPFGTALVGETGSTTFPRDLGIYVSAGDTYERVSNSYTNAGFMQGSITHFGFLFAGDPKTPEQAACP